MDRKLIAIGAGFFGFGALVGWAVTADHWEHKYNEELDILEERVHMLRQHVYALETALEDLNDPTPEAEESPEGESGETNLEEAFQEFSEAEVEETRTNLQKLISQYTENPPDFQEHVVESAVLMETDRTPPFVIPREKFAWDEQEGDQYDKITVTYYPRHRMLLDDAEDPIQDVANTIGWKNLQQFGGESGDPDVVFVRNRRLSTDFEVVRDSENDLPLHIKYGMGKEEFKTNRAAGMIKLRPEDLE